MSAAVVTVVAWVGLVAWGLVVAPRGVGEGSVITCMIKSLCSWAGNSSAARWLYKVSIA